MRKLIALSLLATSLLFGCSEAKTNFSPTVVNDSAGDFVSGSIAIDLKDNMSASDIEEMSKEYGFTIRDSSPLAHSLGNLETADVDPEQENVILNKLAHDPRVEEVEPTILFKAFYEPNDELYPKQWHMKDMGVPEAWKYTAGSRGVIVAVIDTGVDETIPDLKDASFVKGYNFSEGNDKTVDRQSHGTHVCSTIAEVSKNTIGGIGVAPGVRIMPVKVLSDSGSGTNTGVAQGIMFAVDNGANIINMSLGSPQKSSVVAKAVKYAYDHKVAVIVAAGNDASPITGSPAADEGAFAISATDQNRNLTSFSSYGKEVKLAAPGKDILQSTVTRDRKGTPTYENYSGTSMGCPAAAANFALTYSLGITDPDAALKVIGDNAIQKADAKKYGAGIVDAASTTKSIYYNHLLYRAGFLALFTFLLLTVMRKNKRTLVQGTGRTAAIVSAVFASVGILFFLPMTGMLNYMGSFRWVGDLLARPFSEWDMAWNLSVHKWLPLASALPAFLLVSLGNHKPMLRYIAGGLALGTASYLGQVCYSNEIQFVFGSLVMRAWTLVNILGCMWLAKMTLSSSK